MSDIFSTPEIAATPKALMADAQVDRRRADEIEQRADAGVGKLREKRDEEFARRRDKMGQDAKAFSDASKDLQSATAKGPEQVVMPKAETGPVVDPNDAKTFMFGMLAMTLVGARGGKQHFDLALAGLDGALKGYREGNMQRVKEQQATFKREFDVALEKQRQATQRYQDILQSKKLSLNEQAERMRIEAMANHDWDMWNAAQTKDFDGMYRRVDGYRKAADTLESKATTVQQQIDARREKDEAHRRDQQEKRQAKVESTAKAGSDDTATETMAWDYLIKSHNPPARDTGAYQRVMDRVGQIAAENGMTVDQLISASADVKTKLAAKRQFEVRAQNIQRAENQLQREIPVMEDAMAQLDLPSLPAAAKGKVWVLRQMGDPSVAKLDQAAEVVFNEFEGIATGNPGTLNVQDVQNARHAYEQAQTPQQMRAVVEGMRRIITNAKGSLDETRKEIMGDITKSLRPNAKAGAAAGGPAPTNAKGWKLMQDAKGNKAYVSPDGKQFEEAGGE